MSGGELYVMMELDPAKFVDYFEQTIVRKCRSWLKCLNILNSLQKYMFDPFHFIFG